MNRILILLIASLVCGCGTMKLPEQYSASPNRSLVQGVSSRGSSVQIRAVDGGDVLYVGNYRLGDKVWLEPGTHKVSVMCSTSSSWGSYMAGTDVEITIEAGYSYLLTASPMKSVMDKPHVEVAKQTSR